MGVLLTLSGQYRGMDDSGWYEGKKVLLVGVGAGVVPPEGMLRRVAVVPDGKSRGQYGVEEVSECLGVLAVVSDVASAEALSSSVGLGERVTLEANYYPVKNPRVDQDTGGRDMSGFPEGVCFLSGDMKADKAGVSKGFEFRAQVKQLAEKLIEDGRIARVDCEWESIYPHDILKQVRVIEKMDYGRPVRRPEMQEMHGLVFRAGIDVVSRMRPGQSYEVKGKVWPVSVPYWDARHAKVSFGMVPQLRFFAESIRPVTESRESAGGGEPGGEGDVSAATPAGRGGRGGK